MNTSELSARLKEILSIRAVLRRGGISVSSFYTATSRGAAIPSKNRVKIQRALLDTAAELEEIALELSMTEDRERAHERNTRHEVVRLAAKQIEEHGVRTRLEMNRALSNAEERVLRHAFKGAFNRPWSDDADMVSGILSMNRRLSASVNAPVPKRMDRHE